MQYCHVPQLNVFNRILFQIACVKQKLTGSLRTPTFFALVIMHHRTVLSDVEG